MCISRTVRDHVRDKLSYPFQDRGEHALKNIARPVRIFELTREHVANIERDAVAERSKTRSNHASVASAPVPLPDKPTIAVLPFTNMSGDPEQEYFADGMTEEVITALSRVKWFFVVARNSTFAYKGRAVDVKRIGRELNARYVLEGSVRKVGNRIRVTGQLIDADNGTHLWADRFDGEFADVFDLQDQVTQSIVGAIDPTLRLAEIERSKRKPTDNLEAYDLFLRALPHHYRQTREGTQAALALLRKALGLDPRYTAAKASLAYCIAIAGLQNWITSEEDIDEAMRLAREAIDDGRDDPWILHMAGWALAHFGQDLTTAQAALDRSLALNPYSSHAWEDSGWLRVYHGDYETALTRFARALDLSPVEDPWRGYIYTGLAFAQFAAGNYESSYSEACRAVAEMPKFFAPQRMRIAALVQLGRLDEARHLVEQQKSAGALAALAPPSGAQLRPYQADFLSRYFSALRSAGVGTPA